MNILIANDDGVFAPGIQALAKALRPLGRVVIVAPESERSGYSSALTLDRPLRPIQIAQDVWAVNGTPADCVYLSMNGLFDFEFDLVVSGINSGANLGDDVLYSGTVGAAFEGRLMKQPAIAVSLAGSNVRSYENINDYAVAAQWVHDFIKKGLPNLPARHILNINIPDVPELKGEKVTYQGLRGQAKPITSHVDPRGRQVYWIGLAGEAVTDPRKTPSHIQSDFFAVANGYVSITPIQMDATNYNILEDLQTYIG
ncbi:MULTISPECIES: 5'/3'-nucleotidase SurE [Acinetobacter]|uniref:5'-nucleotidase SurE n=2 Tax=Acinetobacter soli TaxID=487316 RepID=A0A1P8EI50_9GAMM|nr:MULTISPECIES: 5'/3'-nucleotidase SurE [Acinetobacter]MCL9676372.1 5'/3'-nucleotidase SurE [Acinetobacter sp. ACZLY 512]APV35894.1 5'/3'-nucleotidase SurE [Acinetobacter soli]ENV59433.1 5'-nucleotidase surE [Acinetobacter soli NIPH 2899]KOR15006.1 stationary phase survival protein SurE [Acinetobacter sp. C15]MBO3640257.1 5'/3'-nucleotidase SurE [Acinetobacter soli]